MPSHRTARMLPVTPLVFASLMVVLAISGTVLGGLCHTVLRQLGFYVPYEAQYDLAYEANLVLDRLSQDLRAASSLSGRALQDGLQVTETMLQIRTNDEANPVGSDPIIRYACEAPGGRLLRQDPQGSAVLLEGIQSCILTPLDRTGQPVSETRLARQVRITLTVQPPPYASGNTPLTFTTTVFLRNLSS